MVKKTITILMAVLLGVQSAYAGGRCDFREPLRDGPGINNLLKNSDHGGLVFLAPPDLPDGIRAQIFEWVPRSPGKKCRWRAAGKRNKKANLRSTGRANGNREHWRNSRELEDLPERCVYVRLVYDLGTDGRVKHCFSMNRVKPERND